MTEKFPPCSTQFCQRAWSMAWDALECNQITREMLFQENARLKKEVEDWKRRHRDLWLRIIRGTGPQNPTPPAA